MTAKCDCYLSTVPIPEVPMRCRDAQRRYYESADNHTADCSFRRNFYDKPRLVAGEYRHFSPVELGFMTEDEYEEAKRWPKAQGRVVTVEDGEVTFELIADE